METTENPEAMESGPEESPSSQCPFCEGKASIPDGYYHEQYRHVIRPYSDLAFVVNLKPADTPFRSGIA